MTHQDWTDKLRDRMADYQAAAPEGLWADIEASLSQPKPKTRTLWQRWVSSAAAVALLVGMGWWLWPREERRLPQKPATLVHQRQHRQPQQPDAELATLTAEELAQVTPGLPTPSRLQEPAIPESETVIEETPVAETAANEIVKEPPVAPHEDMSESIIVRRHVPTREEASHRKRQSQPNRHAVSVSLHANNGLMAYSHSNGVMSAAMSSHYDFSTMMSTRSENQQQSDWLAGYEERQHHYRPISFGLTVSYPLTERWAIETGVVYTRLHADFANKMNQVEINSEQTLHYVGIPLNIQYRVLGGSKWKAYVAAGAEIDWNVKADSKTAGVKTQIKKDTPQWSLGASVGVEYDVIPMLGIYAEPGLRYYFENGSNVRNFFKEQPANWSLQLGIRLNL